MGHLQPHFGDFYRATVTISDRLCFIGINILFILAIGISVKSHIGATLSVISSFGVAAMVVLNTPVPIGVLMPYQV